MVHKVIPKQYKATGAQKNNSLPVTPQKVRRRTGILRVIILTAIISIAGTALYYHYVVMPSSFKELTREKLKESIDEIFD